MSWRALAETLSSWCCRRPFYGGNKQDRLLPICCGFAPNASILFMLFNDIQVSHASFLSYPSSHRRAASCFVCLSTLSMHGWVLSSPRAVDSLVLHHLPISITTHLPLTTNSYLLWWRIFPSPPTHLLCDNASSCYSSISCQLWVMRNNHHCHRCLPLSLSLVTRLRLPLWW